MPPSAGELIAPGERSCDAAHGYYGRACEPSATAPHSPSCSPRSSPTPKRPVASMSYLATRPGCAPRSPARRPRSPLARVPGQSRRRMDPGQHRTPARDDVRRTGRSRRAVCRTCRVAGVRWRRRRATAPVETLAVPGRRRGTCRLLASETSVRTLEDWSAAQSAFDAAVYPSLLVARKGMTRRNGTHDVAGARAAIK